MHRNNSTTGIFAQCHPISGARERKVPAHLRGMQVGPDILDLMILPVRNTRIDAVDYSITFSPVNIPLRQVTPSVETINMPLTPVSGQEIQAGDDASALASQPTLSRFENGVCIRDLWRMRDVFVDHFIQSFEVPPARITLDMDAFDDPAQGQQQLTLFHGHYDQNQYLPFGITCAEYDMTVLVGLCWPYCGVMSTPLTAADLSESCDLPKDIPTQAFAGADRKRFFNRRRAKDPLGEGHAETWRSRLIKVAAEVFV